MTLPQARLQGKRESFLTDVGTQFVIPALGRQRQESLKLKASLGNKNETLFQNKTKQQQGYGSMNNVAQIQCLLSMLHCL